MLKHEILNFLYNRCPTNNFGESHAFLHLPLAERVKRIQDTIDVKDTYCFVISPGVRDAWESIREFYKDWIVFESPKAFNLIHEERAAPSCSFLVLEKPREKYATA